MYYPLLRNSTNEIKALQNLKETSKSNVIPIIESKSIKLKNIINWYSTFNTLGSYLKNRIEEMHFIYDFNTSLEELDNSEELITSTGENLVEFCSNKMRESGLNFIPCFQHDSPEWMIESIVASDNESIAIRVKLYEFQESFDKIVYEKIKKDIEKTSTSTGKLIILDFFNNTSNLKRINNAITIFSKIENSEIVYLATACPENADEAERHDLTLVGSREELNNYLTLKADYPKLHFGDYTVRLKGKPLNGFNLNNSYLKIFYSTYTDYWIAKSLLIGDDAESTFHEVCKKLIDEDFYNGPDFSYGDYEIYRCANNELIIREHQAPIAIGINHHIELTIHQLLERDIL